MYKSDKKAIFAAELRGRKSPLFIFWIHGQGKPKTINKKVVQDRIEQLLAAQFEETKDFLVDIKIGANGHIQVFIDSLDGLEISTCAKTSRHLEHHLEEEALVPEKYLLDVSSPGADKPFKVKQQYTKYLGKNVEVVRDGHKPFKGTLMNVSEDGFTVEEVVKLKKKKEERVLHRIGFDEVKSVKAVISFS